ncbi:pyridoxamine 5'-phosphate oxidase [Psychrobium sp. 1_MG-2023]|uniref:pyridoxamine 5'-phosphate oxidase n=1 Tax=Psychrobium sp. 1_MG-2023 TaxID=3062624 RepID=UPI000C3220C0|nr:pyridoxamine 5'-phosphate oxidase [Psychrobium sp. 1_MG-2023]MDP2562354.1 pyridoxamine 5'-phosphate oxidase [Psychrobium sp. 1_MG-2023]PKF58040.1 pyridoxamine 5'-phosphate oxidase [Alteromonadales bacterium alter-6D02]
MSLLTKLRCLITAGQGVTGSNIQVDVLDDPIKMFGQWFEQAKEAGIVLPESVTVATASQSGIPSARVVLLKSFDDSGFTFYTNYNSRKGQELVENPQAAMVFHWNILQRQVRIEGRVERVSEAESLEYFHSRPRGSQIGAWASYQSQEIESREVLAQKSAELEKKYAGKDIPLPPFWGGFKVIPTHIELWQGRADRLHDRYYFTQTGNGWQRTLLSP